MSTEVISPPTISHRGRRRLLLAALATVAAVGVAGAVVARTSGGTSGGHTVAKAPVVIPPPNIECGLVVEYLAGEVGTMSETVRLGVIAGLSPQMRSLVERAVANQVAVSVGSIVYGFPYSPPVPDGPRLTQLLAAIPAADASVIVGGLSPERRAEIGTSPVAASPAGAVCP